MNMKNVVLVGCAVLMGTAVACKEQPGGSSSAPANQPYSAARAQNTNRAMTQNTTGQSATGQSAMGQSATAQNATGELSGTIKSVDKDKRSLTIAPAAGGQQDVKLAESATVTRDGQNVGLDKLEPGDNVRASFDPTTKQASAITVQSNQTNKAK
jgi:hypothetical protein